LLRRGSRHHGSRTPATEESHEQQRQRAREIVRAHLWHGLSDNAWHGRRRKAGLEQARGGRRGRKAMAQSRLLSRGEPELQYVHRQQIIFPAGTPRRRSKLGWSFSRPGGCYRGSESSVLMRRRRFLEPSCEHDLRLRLWMRSSPGALVCSRSSAREQFENAEFGISLRRSCECRNHDVF